ncbi:dehydrodolichyl diphosphate synthase complex subunit nus1-like isoform X1 [Dermacentor andersoni]|uniref:dehydrodolichyl diphosphate synthase complex subunit nus1-like isoform X1 n=1 Tax=Dermacentor andersoni TaxID=34620 RepID=UPI002155F8D2|nr:dehydrodolichyl diphosphate synthase complex subunit nus1-like isoform X1 [Dermacentor andersoni]
MFITSFVYKVILCILHVCLYVLDVFLMVKHKLLHRLKYSSVHDAKFADAKLPCSSSAHTGMDLLQKVPKHIAVLIGEHDISYRDAANLVVWCLFAGIPHVTLYDAEGALKENVTRLYKEITRSQVEHFGCNGRCKVVLHVKGQELPEKNGQRNGYKQHINVHLASGDDGRPHLASIARTFCQAVERGEMVPSDITPHLIQQELGDVPDPELLLKCGCVHSLLGYPPWQIRLTEIVTLPTHHNLRLSEFFEALAKYNKREQRFGK